MGVNSNGRMKLCSFTRQLRVLGQYVKGGRQACMVVFSLLLSIALNAIEVDIYDLILSFPR
ncbi:hypothetical protein SAMN04488056_1332 [Cohaesibacter marisflavi]|uniref:Uncharacterized protein n=1 Tax=Cohaesibacter marisflavi TaxID=655353 RepID=A0A1I5NIP2_9HYPH|nr:hypothetical protein SAMN04488056_1332 [Cohaesibacter marisflavi]